MTGEGLDSGKAVLGAGKCLTALVPFVGLTFVFPTGGFSIFRRFKEGAETIWPEDLTEPSGSTSQPKNVIQHCGQHDFDADER